jgi:hypothetical protein
MSAEFFGSTGDENYWAILEAKECTPQWVYLGKDDGCCHFSMKKLLV